MSTWDTNRDGVLSRGEWRGTAQEFRARDQNADGVLSGTELRSGIWRNAPVQSDDLSDDFARLDVDNSGRIELDEWRGNRVAFNRLDVNRDGILTRREMQASSAATGTFASLDADRDGVISVREWNSTRQSFRQRDVNGDGVLSRREYNNNARVYENDAVRASRVTRDIFVDAREEWTNSGVAVQAGDVITVDASGTIRLSTDANDIASPAHGAPSGRRAPNAPLRDHAAGVLLVRVGSEVRYVGANGSFAAPTSGQVYLGVNDDHFPDNGGGYRVMMTVDNR